jgi:hypothetical protein
MFLPSSSPAINAYTESIGRTQNFPYFPSVSTSHLPAVVPLPHDPIAVPMHIMADSIIFSIIFLVM